MKLLSTVFAFYFLQQVVCQNLQESCAMPADIPLSRQKRLHHPCESNQNRDFAIETNANHYCIYYSTLEIGLFGLETTIEIKLNGSFDYEQTGPSTFDITGNALRLTASTEDVVIMLKKRENSLPFITSVTIQDNEDNRQELCNCNCGLQDEAVGNILGGVEAREGAWPWNAGIYYKPTVSTLTFRCGATMINSRTLLTTATCLITQDKEIHHEKLLVAAKETTLYGAASSRIGVEKVRIHENFTTEDSARNRLKFDFNVALLITETEIPTSLHVHAICLPESDKFDFRGKTGTVVGWGNDENHQISLKLQQLEVPTFPFLECFFRNREFFSGHASKRNFCAGYKKGKGICSGDAGGGLFIKIGKRFFIYGLSSFSNCKCVKETQKCEIFDEGIFVNVAAYVQWIHNNMF